MPKRSNEFQHLIARLHAQLHDQAIVEESKIVTNTLTGQKSEVDIYIEESTGEYTVKIGVECVARKRPQSVEWVQQQYTKHKGLTDKLILVSKSGFTKDAIALAQQFGIETIKLAAAEKADWTHVVSKTPEMSMTSSWYPVIRCQLIWRYEKDAPIAEDYGPNTLIFGPTDKIETTLGALASGTFHSPEVQNIITDNPSNLSESLKMNFKIKAGFYVLDPLGKKHYIKMIRFEGHVKQERFPIKLEHASFKETQIAYGRVAENGPAVLIVERDGKPIRMSIEIGGQ